MKKSIAATFVALMFLSAQAKAADQIHIVGSSTVYPFTTVVAEKFGKQGKFKTPIVESTGTGGGFKLFCAGAGLDTPDINDASRRIKPDELVNCFKNNVRQISEVKIGYDGIVIANSVQGKQFSLSLKDLALALGKKVPDPKDAKKLIDNPYKNWSEVNKDLPNQKIEVYGPPPTSGTRDSFAELAMEGGCANWDAAKTAYPDADNRKKACRTIREDGAYIEAGENDNLIVQKLKENKNALGIFGFSFLIENKSIVQGSKVSGVAPSAAAILDGSYILSRPLFVYVKRSHIGKVPGIQEFLNEYTSNGALGSFGYLSGRGLVPMTDADLKTVQADIKAGKQLNNLAEGQ